MFQLSAQIVALIAKFLPTMRLSPVTGAIASENEVSKPEFSVINLIPLSPHRLFLGVFYKKKTNLECGFLYFYMKICGTIKLFLEHIKRYFY